MTSLPSILHSQRFCLELFVLSLQAGLIVLTCCHISGVLFLDLKELQESADIKDVPDLVGEMGKEGVVAVGTGMLIDIEHQAQSATGDVVKSGALDDVIAVREMRTANNTESVNVSKSTMRRVRCLEKETNLFIVQC